MAQIVLLVQVIGEGFAGGKVLRANSRINELWMMRFWWRCSRPGRWLKYSTLRTMMGPDQSPGTSCDQLS